MKILLTIDDTPSKTFLSKIELLHAKGIPAILFCRGDGMSVRLPQIVTAIKKGFIIGNHAFDHPRFSSCNFEQCKDQILRTEELINRAYELAGIRRPCKLFRFPFGDRGRGDTQSKVQSFLKEQGFVSLASMLSERIYSFNHAPDLGTDSLWSFDVLEYKTMSQFGREKTGLKTTKDVTDRIADYLDRRKRHPATEVVLLHDFDRTDYMFADIVKALTAQGLEFVNLHEFLPQALTADVATIQRESGASLQPVRRELTHAFDRHTSTSAYVRPVKRSHEQVTEKRSEEDIQTHIDKKARHAASTVPNL